MRLHALLTTGTLVAALACADMADAAPSTRKKAGKGSAKRTHAVRTQSAVAGPLYATRPEVLRAARALAARNDLPEDVVVALIGQARYQSAIAQAVLPAAQPSAKNWAAYRERFVEPRRIAAAVAFWEQHRELLARVQEETGVGAHIIVGILGVETFYGRQTGNHRVLDALCTLAFDFPDAHPRAAQRSAFFLSELEAYLRLTQRTGANALALRGSYAGALGVPQFMPSSWEKYALDGDQDGRTDLFYSVPDIVASVANYFRAFGWQGGQPTHFAAEVDADNPALAQLLAPDIVPSFSAEQLQALGVRLAPLAMQYPHPLALVQLHNADAAPSYVAGTANFHTITRYNWSSYYAMAVIALGEAARQALPPQATTPDGPSPSPSPSPMPE
ncbi:MAG: lytic murein transglycosylase B [Rhodoferax sp.]